MADSSYSDEQNRLIHQLKRSRWRQKGGGEEYQYYAYKSDPITRLKNLTEISAVLRHAKGPRVLDAGAGTGRFTFPLREKGFAAIALDISTEMLNQGRKLARGTGAPFPCLVGDIERLPFEDAAFDSVVSITVLRHFPDWRAIFAEYVRVLRPHGRIVMDMASADQRDFLARYYGAPDAASAPFDPITYDAALSMRGLEALARQHELTIVETQPYDFFHVNGLLLHALEGPNKMTPAKVLKWPVVTEAAQCAQGLAESTASTKSIVPASSNEAFEKRLFPLLERTGAITFYEYVMRAVFPALSPALSSSWLMVLEKSPGGTAKFIPRYRRVRAQLQEAMKPEEIARQCLGAAMTPCAADMAGLLADPGARELFAFCTEEILPRIPVSAMLWETETG